MGFMPPTPPGSGGPPGGPPPSMPPPQIPPRGMLSGKPPMRPKKALGKKSMKAPR